MSKELVISSNRHETKVAILEDDQLVEVYFQRANEYSLAGSIHKGRVTRVLPGMQSAFVDLGLERDAFLYVSDFFEEEDEEFDAVPNGDDKHGRRDRPDRGDRPERAERADRPERTDRPEPSPASVSSQPPIVIPPAPPPPPPAPPAPVAAAGTATALAQAPNRGADDADGRRGRRSRRRRNRGRGFPESKYASAGGPPPTVSTEAEESREEAELPIILPGESLAKYSRSSEPADEDIEPAEAENEFAEQPPVHAEPATESVHAAPEPEFSTAVVAEADPASAEAEAQERDVDRQAETPVPQTIEVAGDDEGESGSANEPDVAVAYEREAAGERHAGPAAEHYVSAVVDRDLEPVVEVVAEGAQRHSEFEEPIASVADALALEDSPEDTDGESDGETDPHLADVESALDLLEAHDTETPSEPSADPEHLSASVRAQQPPRYTQRVSRRMRRKMRSSDRTAEQGPSASEPKTVSRPAPQPERGERPSQPSISELLREGQEIIVQIAKEPIGQKGARITSHIAMPGRYVVFMPTLDHVGVSRKISTDEERLRLKHILHAHRAGIPGGFIVRTAGEGKSEDEIAGDMTYLYNLWIDIRQKAEKRPAPLLLHHDLEIVQRILRDQMTDTFKAIWADNEEMYESVLRFLQRFQPALVNRVKMYTRPAPIFDAFNITPELEKALRPKVWLKSGGYIVINQTEALVAIDVNTGKYVGKSNRLEDTIVKTNLEAVKEIVRQIRLRDLGGIIVVDFIDMDERKNRQKVMQALEETMRVDKAPYKILQFNDFGLVAITRKRVKQSLERTLCAPCPACEGAGYVKSVQTVIGEILQEAQKIARAIEGKEVVLRVHPEVAKTLKSNTNKYLEELEETLGRPVMVVSDATLQSERFDLT